MKKFKTGFSLAELLIVLAIVSVIAIMGFSMAKRGIERAYDMYIYTGYKGLIDAIAFANTKNITASNDQTEFFTELASILDAQYINNENVHTIRNKNGIEYQFRGGLPGGQYQDFVIHFIVPRSSFIEDNAVQNRIAFLLRYYFTPNNLNIILPQIGQVYYPKADGSYGIAHSVSIDLPNRKDLLPFYIDDGESGRTINGGYNSKTYYSIREAYCKSTLRFTTANGSLEKFPNGSFAWDCNGISGTNSINGSIQIENPRKISAF